MDNNLPESKNDPNLVAAIRRWFRSGVSGVITADGVPAEMKPENVQRRQEIADLEAAKLESEAKAARRVEAAKAKAETARVKAAEEAERRRAAEAARQFSGLDQGRTASETPVAPEPAPRPASAPNKLQMNCHPEHSLSCFVTYNGYTSRVLVTGSGQGITRSYPVRDIRDDSGAGVFYVNAKRNDQHRTMFFAFNYSNDGNDSSVRVKGINGDGVYMDARDACTPVQN